MSPEEVIRKFFDCYTNGRPQDFDEVVAPDYLDYGHTPPGRGPDGARADYENAVKVANFLAKHAVSNVIFPGLQSGENKRRADTYLKGGYGGLVGRPGNVLLAFGIE